MFQGLSPDLEEVSSSRSVSIGCRGICRKKEKIEGENEGKKGRRTNMEQREGKVGRRDSVQENTPVGKRMEREEMDSLRSNKKTRGGSSLMLARSPAQLSETAN